MRNKKASWPVIFLAFGALAGLLYYMGKVFLAEPVSVHTEPPPWIDAATNKPKAWAGGSGKPQGKPGTGSAAPASMTGRPVQ
jgi:hypothetical protein